MKNKGLNIIRKKNLNLTKVEYHYKFIAYFC